MQSALEEYLSGSVFAFIVVFVRLGTALMVMPGFGDNFVPDRIKLLFALSLSFVMFPVVMTYIPSPLPDTFGLLQIIISEFLVGLFIATMARIFMMAMDTAGMVISTQSGLGSAQIFNPALASQGSLIGTFLIITGIVFIFITGMHHFLIRTIVESYTLFPVGTLPDTGGMAEMMSKAVAAAFMLGIKIAMPFIILTLLIYVAMGVLSRLMPQIQVFMVALPLQILLSLILLGLSVPVMLHFWSAEFEKAMMFFLSVFHQ